MGAAIVGIFLGVAGLVFGIVSKSKADELRSDFAQVQELVEKIQRVEESSSGISASATRIRREVDSLREGTQGALNQVSDELTRLRRDLNESLSLARGLERKVTETQERPSPPESPEVVSRAPAPVESVVEEGGVASANGDEQIYVIRAGDTLTRVAAAHNISLTRLTDANPGLDPHRLQVGQQIRIPAR